MVDYRRWAEEEFDKKKHYLSKKKYEELSGLLVREKFDFTEYHKIREELHKAEYRHLPWYKKSPENLKEIRKKYVGQEIDPEKIKKSDWSPEDEMLIANYSVNDRNGMDTYYYEAAIFLSDDRSKIDDVCALKCEALLWSDARNVGLHPTRASDIDYMRLDSVIAQIVVFPDQEKKETETE